MNGEKIREEIVKIQIRTLLKAIYLCFRVMDKSFLISNLASKSKKREKNCL
jgi:hypothetical protein